MRSFAMMRWVWTSSEEFRGGWSTANFDLLVSRRAKIYRRSHSSVYSKCTYVIPSGWHITGRTLRYSPWRIRRGKRPSVCTCFRVTMTNFSSKESPINLEKIARLLLSLSVPHESWSKSRFLRFLEFHR